MADKKDKPSGAPLGAPLGANADADAIADADVIADAIAKEKILIGLAAEKKKGNKQLLYLLITLLIIAITISVVIFYVYKPVAGVMVHNKQNSFCGTYIA
jgi:hypothetical protein